MENETQISTESKRFDIKQTIKQNKKLAALVIIVLAAALAYLLMRSVFFAASVDGHIISRYKLVKELEKQGGPMVLESLITNQLVENAINKEDIKVAESEIQSEVNIVEESIARQGGSLTAVLTQQGISDKTFRKDIILKKKIQKLLSDKTTVTPEEVEKYIKENKIKLEKNKEDQTRNTIKEELTSQKFNQEVRVWITGLKEKAKIKQYLNFK